MPGDQRDRADVEALLVDAYLDALLAAADRRASGAPHDVDLDPALASAARRLRGTLTPVHPSFRFEERLAARLAEVAVGMRLAAAAGAEAIPLRPDLRPDAPTPDPAERAIGIDAAFGPPIGGQLDHPPGVPRPLLIGGALTSAAISIAGAAYVAWRRSRPPAGPMARAVRLARDRRRLD